MIRISLCMIVKNEEDVLERCLRSVQKYMDEIVIVDTGSTDQTRKIAEKFTDQIYEFPWIDDFSAARNEAFSKANMEYLMWMDADDILTQEDGEKLQKLKEELEPSVDLVMMKYNTEFDEEGRPVFTYYRERLMKRSVGYRWKGEVHEAIVPSGKIIYSDVAVTHRKLHPSDPDRNLRIFEKLLRKGKPLEPRQEFYYARELYGHGRYEEAIRMYTQFLNEKRGWIENNITACLDLCRCYQKQGKDDLALSALFQSFSYDRPRAEICCAVGESFMAKKEYRTAVFWYRVAAEDPINETSGGFCLPDCHHFIPYLQMCVCYDRLGEREQALFYHEKAKEQKPQHPSVRYNEAYFT